MQKPSLKRILNSVATSLVLLSSGANCEPSLEAALRGTSWDLAGRKHQVDPLLMYAVALQESRRIAGKGMIAPHPFAMNSSRSGALFPDSREKAAATLQEELKTANNVDVCPMQISLRWNGSLVQRPSDLFDIRTCLDVGARLLSTALRSAPGDLELGIGRYHTWNSGREADARRYGRDVLQIWINLLSVSS